MLTETDVKTPKSHADQLRCDPELQKLLEAFIVKDPPPKTTAGASITILQMAGTRVQHCECQLPKHASNC